MTGKPCDLKASKFVQWLVMFQNDLEDDQALSNSAHAKSDPKMKMTLWIGVNVSVSSRFHRPG